MFDKITEIKYNLPQSSLKVMFVEYAKRLKKIQIPIRSHEFDPLGRTKPFFTVLQINFIKKLYEKIFSLGFKEQFLKLNL